jgi:hypothetical protein
MITSTKTNDRRDFCCARFASITAVSQRLREEKRDMTSRHLEESDECCDFQEDYFQEMKNSRE